MNGGMEERIEAWRQDLRYGGKNGGLEERMEAREEL